MKRAEFWLELAKTAQLSSDEKDALRAYLRNAALAPVTCGHEPMPEADAAIEQIVAAYSAGMARAYADAMQTALIRYTVAEVGGSPGVWAVVDEAVRQHNEARGEALQLLAMSVHERDPEKLLQQLTEEPASLLVVLELIRLGHKSAITGRSSNAAKSKNREARTWVAREWTAHKSEYASKQAFCDAYVAKVAEKFQGPDGKPLEIGERQMKERWLSK